MTDLPLQVTAFLILFARLGAVLMLLPVFSDDAVPGRIRLLTAFGLSLALWGLMSSVVLPAARDGSALAGIIAVELCVGLALGMIVRLMFQAAVMAASIASTQMGLSSAIIFDPALGGQAPVLAKMVVLAATLVCLGLGLHHLWIAAMIRSYDIFPVGAVPNLGDFASLAVTTIGRAMALAVSLSAPLLVYGIVFNVALGFSARLAPTIQVFFIAQPLNILLGTALFAVVVGAMITAFASAMSDWMQSGWA
ncbi:flagellar biosynthetic protein FliR [Novosphingobium sp. M1R2S20]|uniref:Flagellar biosynthetic protein FliR n=1 Tax=Novosphingobium rhizovicinum TaxID=3228928 RepID=A0ABV3R8W0_9SPHN